MPRGQSESHLPHDRRGHGQSLCANGRRDGEALRGEEVMRHTVSMAAACVGLLLSAVPMLAHHSFAAEFDANRPVTLKGTVTKAEWINPHAWVYLDVKDDDGKVVNWSVEL